MAVAPADTLRPARPPLRRLGLRAALGGAVPVALLMLWVAAVRERWVLPYQLPPPGAILRAAEELAARGDLLRHVAATAARLLAGYGVGAVPALVLGVAAGLCPAVRCLVEPVIQGVRAVPSLAWVPLFLLWFGIGETARVLLIALGAFLPVYVNTVAGVEGADRRLVEVGRAYGLSPAAVVARIVFPASLPAVLTGLRSGLSLAWMFVVAAELIAASSGLGFLLTEGQATMRVDRMLAALLAFALLGRASDAGLAAIERFALRWRDTIAAGRQGA